MNTNSDWRNWLADLLGIHPDNRDELLGLLHNLQKDRQLFPPNEMLMIEGVLMMRKWKIRDVMIPLADVIGVSEGEDYAKVVATVRECQHSRYPVFSKDGERVKGILLAKDLLSYTTAPNQFKVSKVMRPPVFEPTSKTLDVLLEDFRAHRSHMIVAVDEHALPAGIMTIEDLLERIVGEIEDESDEMEDKPSVELEDGNFLVKGTLSVEEFNQQFKSHIPSNSADNIAGWLCAEMGYTPPKGQIHRAHGMIFTIAEATKKRVINIVVRRDPKAD